MRLCVMPCAMEQDESVLYRVVRIFDRRAERLFIVRIEPPSCNLTVEMLLYVSFYSTYHR